MQDCHLKYAEWYVCRDYFVFLWPDKEAATALDGVAVAAARAAIAAEAAAYWARGFGKPVFYLEKNQPFLVLEGPAFPPESPEGTDLWLVKVLSKERVGWIIYQDWLPIEEALG
jgi:hypothetical protein